MNQKTTESLMFEIMTIKNYLIAAQDVLKSGFMPDITALGKRTADLCEALQKAPKETAQVCMVELHDIVQRLNTCEKEMRAFHEARTKTGS